MKAVVAAFNQEKALVGAFSVITNLRMELFQALVVTGQLAAWRGILDSVKQFPISLSSLSSFFSPLRIQASSLSDGEDHLDIT